MYTLIGYKKCSTCKKAEKFLMDRKVDYIYRDIKENRPSKKELEEYIKSSGKDIKCFFNTSGLVYKSLNLKENLKTMSFDDKINALASDGMLVKRPILLTEDNVLVGFKTKEWKEII